MKIRWTADSIRFRITPAEMKQLVSGESVAEVLNFGTGQWSAQIARRPCHQVTFTGGNLILELSAQDIATLTAPENEGVYFHQDGMPQRYFVEKDYPCVHPRRSEALEPVTETFVSRG